MSRNPNGAIHGRHVLKEWSHKARKAEEHQRSGRAVRQYAINEALAGWTQEFDEAEEIARDLAIEDTLWDIYQW